MLVQSVSCITSVAIRQRPLQIDGSDNWDLTVGSDQLLYNNSSYQKRFVSIVSRKVWWKFCTLKYFILYVLYTYMTANGSLHILKYLILNIIKTKGTNL